MKSNRRRFFFALVVSTSIAFVLSVARGATQPLTPREAEHVGTWLMWGDGQRYLASYARNRRFQIRSVDDKNRQEVVVTGTWRIGDDGRLRECYTPDLLDCVYLVVRLRSIWREQAWKIGEGPKNPGVICHSFVFEKLSHDSNPTLVVVPER
jgi:hypothetical protein